MNTQAICQLQLHLRLRDETAIFTTAPCLKNAPTLSRSPVNIEHSCQKFFGPETPRP